MRRPQSYTPKPSSAASDGYKGQLLRRECSDVRIIVGGAVLTPHLAEYAGADYYAKDAMETVRIAEKLSAEAK